MLERGPSGSGWQVTLRARGVLRFFAATFLGAWLCGWAAGEYFGLGLLGAALRSALGPDFAVGWLPVVQGKLPPPSVFPFMFAFVTVWLSLWTFGGLAALSEFLRLLCGSESVSWSGEALVVERRAPFLTSVSRLEPRDVTGFRTRAQALLADTPARAVTVARLGTAEERMELLGLLEAWRQTFGPAAPFAADRSPVPGWCVTIDESGVPAIAPSPAIQRGVAGVLAALGMAFVGAAAAVGSSRHGTPALVVAGVLGLPGAVCLYGATWLLAVRESWHPRTGTLERRRTGFGRVWSRTLAPLALELRVQTDSDGDARWRLVASGGGHEQVIASSLRDPNLPSSLGHWLADRTGVELVQKGQESRFRKAG